MKFSMQDKAKFQWRVRELMKIFGLFALMVVAAMVAFRPAREIGLTYLAAGLGVTSLAVAGTYIFSLLGDIKSEQRLAQKRAQEQAYRQL
jgi:hypothetical protein